VQSLGNGTAFSAVAPSQRPVCDAHQSKIFGGIPIIPPAPKTWTCNILPLWSVPPRTSAFCQPDPHCPAVWPVCHIPPGKLPVCLGADLFHAAPSPGTPGAFFTQGRLAPN
jgi:hypothetical protein